MTDMYLLYYIYTPEACEEIDTPKGERTEGWIFIFNNFFPCISCKAFLRAFRAQAAGCSVWRLHFFMPTYIPQTYLCRLWPIHPTQCSSWKCVYMVKLVSVVFTFDIIFLKSTTSLIRLRIDWFAVSPRPCLLYLVDSYRYIAAMWTSMWLICKVHTYVHTMRLLANHMQR